MFESVHKSTPGKEHECLRQHRSRTSEELVNYECRKVQMECVVWVELMEPVDFAIFLLVEFLIMTRNTPLMPTSIQCNILDVPSRIIAFFKVVFYFYKKGVFRA